MVFICCKDPTPCQVTVRTRHLLHVRDHTNQSDTVSSIAFLQQSFSWSCNLCICLPADNEINKGQWLIIQKCSWRTCKQQIMELDFSIEEGGKWHLAFEGLDERLTKETETTTAKMGGVFQDGDAHWMVPSFNIDAISGWNTVLLERPLRTLSAMLSAVGVISIAKTMAFLSPLWPAWTFPCRCPNTMISPSATIAAPWLTFPSTWAWGNGHGSALEIAIATP